MKLFIPMPVRSVALLFLLSLSSLAQKGPDLPADHPEVYYSFFFFIEGFGRWLDARAIQAPDKQDALVASAARYLKVDIKELPKLISACELVVADLRKINDEAHLYRAGEIANGRTPNAGTVQSFEERRQLGIRDGISRLQNILSEASWKGVHAHINGTHRAMLHQIR